MLRKLRIRFVGLSLAIFAVMLAAIFSLVYYFTGQNLESRSIAYMEFVQSSRVKLTDKMELGSENRIPCFTVETSSRGEMRIYGVSYYDLSDMELVGELMTCALNNSADRGVIKEYNLRYLRRDTPTGWQIVFSDISAEREMLSGLLRELILIWALGLGLFFVCDMFFVSWATRPVEKAWAQQRQFVADASHELKTPLAVIMANAELLQNAEYSEQERAHFGESILIMSHKMRELVERLLELARADNGQSKTDFSAIDFSTLVSDAVLPFEPLFYEKALSLESDVAPGISIRGDAQHLRQTVEILLDNAQKYSLPGAVRLTLSVHDKSRCLLTVENPAEEISAAELKDIFKRFYRLDKARTGGDSGSYGLGLPIAENFVTEHGGKIWAEYKNGNVIFSVLLPVLHEK